MEDIQAVHRQNNHNTIHSVEVDLSGHDPAVPTIGEFDGSVHGSGVDREGAKRGSTEHHLHLLVQEVVARWWVTIRPLEGHVVDVTEDELDGEDHVEGDGNHLENDTAQHNFSTRPWVLDVVTGGCGSNDTTNTLNCEGDNISGEKDDGIWRVRRMINLNSETAALLRLTHPWL